MTFDDAVRWLHARLGMKINVDVGATKGDPEFLVAFSGRLTRGTPNLRLARVVT